MEVNQVTTAGRMFEKPSDPEQAFKEDAEADVGLGVILGADCDMMRVMLLSCTISLRFGE
jgi:hypothetical protein